MSVCAMNEFTKEELEILRKAIQSYICDFECYKSYSITKDKIQSLIDNYCNHDAHETSALINYCHKCNHAEFISL